MTAADCLMPERAISGVFIFMEMMRRLKAGIYGGEKAPKHLIDACWIDGKYCLDAPDIMPAGGCIWHEIDEEFGGLPEQLTINRETV